MALFGNKRDDDALPKQDLQELFQRLEHLERKCRRMEARITELEETVASQRNNADSVAAEHPVDGQTQESATSVQPVGINMSADVQLATTPQPAARPEPHRVEPTVFYLPAPSADGLFQQASLHEQIGKSIYQLTTTDGQNGTFILLDTPDAIATATISVSAFVKPVCRIIGSTSQQPRHIITEEEGAVAREGADWRVTRKAVVRFE